MKKSKNINSTSYHLQTTTSKLILGVYLLIIVTTLVPLVFSGNVYVYAGTTVTEGGGTTTVTEGGGGCPTGATQTSGSVSIPNPLCAKSFTDLANTIAFFMLKVASPIAIIMVIWSGLLFMTSGGDETKVKSAKDTLLWTIVAIVVIALSFSVTSILNSLLK